MIIYFGLKNNQFYSVWSDNAPIISNILTKVSINDNIITILYGKYPKYTNHDGTNIQFDIDLNGGTIFYLNKTLDPLNFTSSCIYFTLPNTDYLEINVTNGYINYIDPNVNIYEQYSYNICTANLKDIISLEKSSANVLEFELVMNNKEYLAKEYNRQRYVI